MIGEIVIVFFIAWLIRKLFFIPGNIDPKPKGKLLPGE